MLGLLLFPIMLGLACGASHRWIAFWLGATVASVVGAASFVSAAGLLDFGLVEGLAIGALLAAVLYSLSALVGHWIGEALGER